MRQDHITSKLVEIPNVEEVCELLDIGILHDIEPLSNDEEDYRYKPVVALGQRAEYGAGLMGLTVTPWFENYEQLEAFCAKHIDRFRVESSAGTCPDATDWEL
jgi:hypothetical protein